jgi:serine/threonine protein kinase
VPATSDIYTLGNFIDTYALGHYARVVEATDRRDGRVIALKVMRPEHVVMDDAPRWEAEAFVHEADLLTRLSHSNTPIRYYDCGFIDAVGDYPEGDIVSLRTDLARFREELFARNAAGWRPYLALEYLPRHQNLFYLMKPTQAGQRRRLPTEEALALAMQFGALLMDSHEENIFYLDHKLEHVYWDGHKLRVIDFNSSKLVKGDTQAHAISQQKDVHNLCVGILYPAFTGLSPVRGELRAQPASQQEVEARYSDVSSLDFSPEPTLSQQIIELLERGARQGFETAAAFLQHVEQVATHFGWEFRFQVTEPALSNAREQIRQGLAKLRSSSDQAREARELLMEAAIMDGINEDMERELRRLMKAINDYLNARVVP